MQDRYAGDIGDYVKLALLRAVGTGRRLGIAWYLYPDESHNGDGRHTRYLQQPEKWRWLDPELFDALGNIVDGARSVRAIEKTSVLSATFHSEPMASARLHWKERSAWRSTWFSQVGQMLDSADLVFADPDNGLVDDDPRRRNRAIFGKQMPLSEARALAKGRPAIVYHHNTRRPGGHDVEVDHWLGELGQGTLAIRATSHSCRTFFVLNPDHDMRKRVEDFCARWSGHRVRLHAAG